MAEKRSQRGKVSFEDESSAAPKRGGRAGYFKPPEWLKPFSPKAGSTYRVMFLPWLGWTRGLQKAQEEKKRLTAARFIYVHRDVGPDGQILLCPKMESGGRCPVCETFAIARQDGPQGGETREQQWKRIRGLQPQAREIRLLHLLGGRVDELLYWDESCYTFGNNFREKLESKKKYQEYANYNDGWVVELKPVSKSIPGGGAFLDFPNIEMEKLSETDDVLSESLLDLTDKVKMDDYLSVLSYKQFHGLLHMEPVEEEKEESETEDEDEAPKSRRKKSKEEEEEDENEDAADDEVEDEEPEEPTSRISRAASRKVAKPPPPEEEEEEEDDEDEDPEPEPDPKPKPKPKPKPVARKSSRG